MKLRIHEDSLRLRLNRSDVEQFRETGICAESLRFGSGSQLIYTLEICSRLTVSAKCPLGAHCCLYCLRRACSRPMVRRVSPIASLRSSR